MPICLYALSASSFSVFMERWQCSGYWDAPESKKSTGADGSTVQLVNRLIGAERKPFSERKVYFGSLFEGSTVLHGREGRATEVASSISAGTWHRFTRGGWLGQETTHRI